MHDIAVGDDVMISFEPHLARFACPALATEGDVILVPDGLGANEPRSKSEWMTAAACGALVPRVIVQAAASLVPR